MEIKMWKKSFFLTAKRNIHLIVENKKENLR